jgi:hypothetical protein
VREGNGWDGEEMMLRLWGRSCVWADTEERGSLQLKVEDERKGGGGAPLVFSGFGPGKGE